MGSGPRPPVRENFNRSERAAWRVQEMFRRWSVFIAINVIALVWLVFGNSQAQIVWNYTWSDLAVDVEFVTALALVSLARRDHETIVELKKITSHIEKMMEHHGIDRE